MYKRRGGGGIGFGTYAWVRGGGSGNRPSLTFTGEGVGKKTKNIVAEGIWRREKRRKWRIGFQGSE